MGGSSNTLLPVAPHAVAERLVDLGVTPRRG